MDTVQTSCESPRRLHLLKAGLVILVLIVIGLATVDDYGISSDERVDTLSVFWNIRLIESGQSIPPQRRYYGNLFNSMAEAIYQTKYLVGHGTPSRHLIQYSDSPDLTRKNFLKESTSNTRSLFCSLS
jgi:hypothetical protein